MVNLEITKVVLVQCNTINNYYQHDSRVLYTFVPNIPVVQLLEVSTTNFILLETFNSEFQSIEVWFPDQNSQQNSDPRDRMFVKKMLIFVFCQKHGYTCN